MKELRPLGSEKLNGDEKLKRILELTYYGEKKPNQSFDKPEYITESKIGGVYGIVKEKDGFYVKKGLNESSLEYIGGMFMKNKNRFTSYGEAFKRLEFLKGQEVLQEATKYVLKQNKPTPPPMEATPPAPSMSEPPAPDSSIPPLPSGDEPAAPEGMPPEGTPPENELGGQEQGDGQDPNLRSGYMEQIQKFAGKLGQELRDQKEKLESDDLKYTLNMIISAMDLDKLDDDDLEEIADKFDRDEDEFDNEEGGEGGDEYEEPAPAPAPEDDLGEVVGDGDDEDLHGFYSRHDLGGDEEIEFDDNDEINFFDKDEDDLELDETMSKLDEFINYNVGEEDNIFSKYADIGKEEEEELDELIHIPSPEPSRRHRRDDEESEAAFFKDQLSTSTSDDESNRHNYSDFDNPDENSDENSDEDLFGKFTKFKYNGEEFSKPKRLRDQSYKNWDRNKPNKIDIDEITNAVNDAIKASLSKYK